MQEIIAVRGWAKAGLQSFSMVVGVRVAESESRREQGIVSVRVRAEWRVLDRMVIVRRNIIVIVITITGTMMMQ